jgi:hypothetical protein
MKTKRILLAIVFVFATGLSACTTAEPTVDNNMLGTIVAQSIQLTQAAQALTSVVAQQSDTPVATLTPIPPTSTATLEPSLTPTQAGVWLTTTANTNCRQGPATYWPIILTLGQGTQVEGIARSTANDFFYVRVIDTAIHYCWVYGPATVSNVDTARLQAYTPVPTDTPTITPTSAANFTVSYVDMTACSGSYLVTLNIKNVGFLTWQSIKMVIVDSSKSVTLTSTADNFTGYSACSAVQTQGDLATNESGEISNYPSAPFTFDPKGDSLSITVYLYSEKGLSGTVVSKTIGVTP